uniref:Uncharacterized protein n=1 Tax=Mesocestoides corti TaxID=53468 RepID=A0A5K3EGH4_MESCO
MLSSSSSDEDVDNRRRPFPSTSTTQITTRGRASLGSSGRGSSGPPSATPDQINRKPQQRDIELNRKLPSNGGRFTRGGHPVFSSASPRLSIRSTDACDYSQQTGPPLCSYFVVAPSPFVEGGAQLSPKNVATVIPQMVTIQINLFMSIQLYLLHVLLYFCFSIVSKQLGNNGP